VYLGGALFVVSKVMSRLSGVMYSALLYPTAHWDERLAHEISSRGVALGYFSMVIFFLIIGGAFLLPAQALDSGGDAEPEAAANETLQYDSCGDVITDGPGPPPPDLLLWLEYRLPIAAAGLWWGLFAWRATFQDMSAEAGPPFPSTAVRGGCCPAEGCWSRRGADPDEDVDSLLLCCGCATPDAGGRDSAGPHERQRDDIASTT
jgi:hypothetical protein